MNKKGQAAMEFLMTYGWAILAAVIAIGVLAYFGVFSPGDMMPTSCALSAPFGCEEYSMTVTGGMQLVIRNGAGGVLDITSVDIDGCGTDSTGWADTANGDTISVQVDPCVPALSDGGRFKGDITIVYRKDDGTLDQQSTGTISGKVTA